MTMKNPYGSISSRWIHQVHTFKTRAIPIKTPCENYPCYTHRGHPSLTVWVHATLRILMGTNRKDPCLPVHPARSQFLDQASYLM